MLATDIMSRSGCPTQVMVSGMTMLKDLLLKSIILEEDWEYLSVAAREELERAPDCSTLLAGLVTHRLLSDYQAARIGAGQMGGLILGNYRVLDRIGAGALGVVFKAEHMLMRRLVAIKVMPAPCQPDNPALTRFVAEMRAVAILQHPNIVAPFEAGKTSGSDHEFANLYYFVMDFVPGMDLEQYVTHHGPLPPSTACDIAFQIGSALAEAHRRNLLHRDIKPSNILLTTEGEAKLTDFGLVSHFQQRPLTQPGTSAGTVDYMAPEQAQDPSSVDIRADIFGLGATLFWCLTGKAPFPKSQRLAQAVLARQKSVPPSPRALRCDIPADLDALVVKSMALCPQDRFPDPQALMESLVGFLKSDLICNIRTSSRVNAPSKVTSPGEKEGAGTGAPRVLIVDDDPSSRAIVRLVLEEEGYFCREADDGATALDALKEQPYDLVFMDIEMPKLSGFQALQRIRENPPSPNLKVIMMSGMVAPDHLAELLAVGADDFLPKPASIIQLKARAKAAFKLKQAQDQSDQLAAKLQTLNAKLAHDMTGTVVKWTDTRNHLIMALAELGALRCGQTDGPLTRIQRYCRCLAEEAARLPAFADAIDTRFIALLECCAPLRDIGNVALPEYVLQKPNKLEPDERILMQTHTTIGAGILEKVVQRSPSTLAFLQMAIDVIRHHHEHFSGDGYPDKLTGSAIPLSARLVAIADVYDALRSHRPHRPALSHSVAVEIITSAKGQFDPALLEVFEDCADRFERIFRDCP
jgi:response regulator RpfG family c-di-GMP phosphodiesterase/serine/threonine protein kinase